MPADYDGDTFDEVAEWLKSAREKGFDQKREVPLDEFVAQKVADELHPLTYVRGEGFRRYADGHWRQIGDPTFDRKAKEIVQPFLKPAQQVMPLLPNIWRCAELNVEQEGFGQYTSKICVRNGTVDVKTGVLREWSQQNGLRYQLGIDFDPNALAPLYEEQLKATLGDDKAIAVFEEFAGLTLVPDLSFQKALYLVGTGGSGKSTLLKLVEAIHSPGAVSVTPLDRIDSERYLTELAGKLVCISFDVQTKQRVFGEAFVRITGGDLITTRRLYHEVEGRVKPTVRFIGSMNPDMPEFIASLDALQRRLIFLPCGQKVMSPDRHRTDRLLSERPGILVRWLAALQRLLARGYFDLPEDSELAVEEYVSTQDAVQVYVGENLILDKTAAIPASELLLDYNSYARNCNERPLSSNVIGKKVKAAGVAVEYSRREVNGKQITARIYRARFKDDRVRY